MHFALVQLFLTSNVQNYIPRLSCCFHFAFCDETFSSILRISNYASCASNSKIVLLVYWCEHCYISRNICWYACKIYVLVSSGIGKLILVCFDAVFLLSGKVKPSKLRGLTPKPTHQSQLLLNQGSGKARNIFFPFKESFVKSRKQHLW